MPKISESREYRAACSALQNLKAAQQADPKELRAIASLLILAFDAELPEERFPFRGDPADPRDRAVVAAYRQAWEEFVEADDD